MLRKGAHGALTLFPQIHRIENNGTKDLEIIEVRNDPTRMKELLEISGQTKTPTLQNGDFIVADFDIKEFEYAMAQNPAESKKLGL